MKLKENDSIEDVEILNPYQLPNIKNLKASIIDVKARDKRGKTYIIGMQVAEPDGLDKRLLYYASKEYSQQIESVEYYTKLKPVIFIGSVSSRTWTSILSNFRSSKSPCLICKK
jgi:predicted transposase/invertase (TIGR01784 family)